MKAALKALFLFISAAALTACNNTPVTPIAEIEGFDYGTVANGKYSNKFFNLEMNIPEGWHVQDTEQMQGLVDKTKEIAKEEGDEIMTKSLNTADITTANLLMVFRSEVGTTPDFNPNFILTVENMQNHAWVKTGKQYLDNTKKLMTQSKMNLTDFSDGEKTTLGGMDFYSMSYSQEVNGMKLQQTIMVTIKKGFAILLISSYDGSEQKEEIEKRVIRSISTYKK